MPDAKKGAVSRNICLCTWGKAYNKCSWCEPVPLLSGIYLHTLSKLYGGTVGCSHQATFDLLCCYAFMHHMLLTGVNGPWELEE